MHQTRVATWLQGMGLLVLALIALWPASSAALSHEHIPADRLTARTHRLRPPGLTIEPYVRPHLRTQMERLRPTILAAAARHNQPALSGMNDQEFAEVMTTILYNEHNGWLEDSIEPLRVLTPWYEYAQVLVNASGIGSDFSVWPVNVRPSVALEIRRGQVPIPDPPGVLTYTIVVSGSRIDATLLRQGGQSDSAQTMTEARLYQALAAEIRSETLAVEYLAANLERGIYRANYEAVPVSWRTLAGWHNQGLVHPEAIQQNAWSRDYVRRASAYLPLARCFVAPECEPD